MQILGYDLIFLANFRFIDFSRFFWQYRIAAYNLVKALFANATTSKSMKPCDYDELLLSTFVLDASGLSQARKIWKTIQSEEVKRTKQLMLNLLKEQIRLK
jgi:hypothetical protein